METVSNPKGQLPRRLFHVCLAFFLMAPFIQVLAQPDTRHLRVGDPMPALHLEGLLQAPKETQAGWEKLRGKVVVLEFWATWCGPCRAALPHLNELADKYKDKPVRFISVTDEEEWKVSNFISVYPIKGWIGLDPGKSLYNAFGFQSIPQTVLVDEKGRVAALVLPQDLNEELLNRLLARQKLVAPSPLPGPAAPPENPKPDEPAVQPLLSLSIRPASPSSSFTTYGGIFRAKGMPLPKIISHVYGISRARVISANPVPETAYEVMAVVPDDHKELLRPLLQQALQVAFGLQVQKETRELGALVLTAPKKEQIKLRPAEKESVWGMMGDEGQVSGFALSVQDFCNILEDSLNQIVLNETGVEGTYDIAFYWNPRDPESVFREIDKQLGLSLKREKRQVEVLVF